MEEKFVSIIDISKDKSLIDLDTVENFMTQESYWAKDRSRETIIASINNSICYSLLVDRIFIGFARVISDKATFAYLCDVFILPEYQKNGFGKKLLKYIINDPEFININIYLLTLDGHSFYSKYDFAQDEDLLRRVMRRKPPK
jgi:N-acetylglutamate synthase-like GNAT family acetyltransferase